MEIEKKIIELIADELAVDEAEVTPNADLSHDLGADSLDAVEIIMRLEEEFDVEIHDEAAESVKTVADAIRIVQERTAAKV